MPVILAKSLILHDVKERFGLQKSTEPTFFWEWQQDLPDISTAEQDWLDRVKSDFIFLEEYPLYEEIVKLSVLAPLLSLAGFFKYPFYPRAEVEVELTVEDSDELIRGRLDILILRQQLWTTVIESKRKQLSLSAAFGQTLFYMLNNPDKRRASLGFITNGSHFRFLKLVQETQPQYALSDEFTIEREGNELYQVLSILRRMGQLMEAEAAEVA